MRAYAIDLPIDLSLLVDTYMVAYYWDGTEADRHGFVSTVPMESPGTFPTGTPVINITYLPFYVTVNQNVVSETYVITDETNFLAGKLGTAGTELTDIDEKTVMFMTLTFDEDDGSFYIGRTANWDGLNMGGSFYLSQFVKTAAYDAGLDEYTLNFSEWDEQSGWSSAEQVLGFSRSASVWDMGTATLKMASGSTQTMPGLSSIRMKSSIPETPWLTTTSAIDSCAETGVAVSRSMRITTLAPRYSSRSLVLTRSKAVSMTGVSASIAAGEPFHDPFESRPMTRALGLEPVLYQ